jgi:hypothetical protein
MVEIRWTGQTASPPFRHDAAIGTQRLQRPRGCRRHISRRVAAPDDPIAPYRPTRRRSNACTTIAVSVDCGGSGMGCARAPDGQRHCFPDRCWWRVAWRHQLALGGAAPQASAPSRRVCTGPTLTSKMSCRSTPTRAYCRHRSHIAGIRLPVLSDLRWTEPAHRRTDRTRRARTARADRGSPPTSVGVGRVAVVGGSG